MAERRPRGFGDILNAFRLQELEQRSVCEDVLTRRHVSGVDRLLRRVNQLVHLVRQNEHRILARSFASESPFSQSEFILVRKLPDLVTSEIGRRRTLCRVFSIGGDVSGFESAADLLSPSNDSTLRLRYLRKQAAGSPAPPKAPARARPPVQVPTREPRH